MLVQQKIAFEKSIYDSSKLLKNNWSFIPLLFVFVFYKIAIHHFNAKLAPLFIAVPLFFTTFMITFNPIVNKIENSDNKLRKKIFIIGLLLTIGITIGAYFYIKDKPEEEIKNYVEKISYSLLLINYFIFLVFNVFFRYSGLNILSNYGIKVSEEINTKYTFFFFICVFLLMIFFVSKPKSTDNKFLNDNSYGLLLILPIVVLLVSYGINIFTKDKSKFIPYVILCISVIIYIINSLNALGYKNEILDEIENKIDNLKNTSESTNKQEEVIEKLESENSLYLDKVNSIKKITSKIPMLFAIISLLTFLVYSIKLKNNSLSVSILLIFCFCVYLSFIMGTSYSNYNINDNLKNKKYSVKNFYWGRKDTFSIYQQLMISVIIISCLLAFSYGYINFFSRTTDIKSYFIKTIIGLIVLAISSFFSYNWGMNIASYNSPAPFDNDSLFKQIKEVIKVKEKYNNITTFENNENNESIIIGTLKQYNGNNPCDNTNTTDTTDKKYNFQNYLDDLNKGGIYYDKNNLLQIPSGTSSCSLQPLKKFNRDTENRNLFFKNIITTKFTNITKNNINSIDNGLNTTTQIYDKYFVDNPNIDEEYLNKKTKFLELFLNKINNITSSLSPNDLYLNNITEYFTLSSNTDISNLKKICFSFFNNQINDTNTKIKNLYINSINNFSNKTTDSVFSYSNILTITLLFFGIFLLSNLKFKYDTIYDNFSITSNSNENVFNLLYSSLIIILIFGIGIIIENSLQSQLISLKTIVPSVLNSILGLLYISTLLIPGLTKKIAFYVIVLLIHLSLFTIPLDEFRDKLSTNIIFLYVVLMAAIGIATYQVLTPSKNKYSSLYMLLIICATFLTLHSAPSIFYLGDKKENEEDSKNKVFTPELLNQLRESANNSWPVLIFGLVMGFILFSKIINPYNVGKLNLTPSKNFFFAKDNN